MASVKAGYWFNGCGASVEKLRSAFFTHLYFGFAGVDSTEKRIKIFKADEDDFSAFTEKVQAKNSSVKTLLSIGGGTAMAKFLAEISEDKDARKSFIDSSIEIARSKNFHGLDLHWKYPKTQHEMENFGCLLNEWRRAIRTESTSSSRDPLLLTAATSFQPKSQDWEYNADVLKQLDWINIIAYDFPIPVRSGDQTEAHAALDGRSNRYSVVNSVNAWRKKIPGGKIVLGLPFHGYAWKLQDKNVTEVSARADGRPEGVGIREDGLINYNYVRDFIDDHAATIETDMETDTKYCFSGTTWISYDDKDSITKKVDRAKTMGLRGYFVSNVGADSEGTLCEAASKEWDQPVTALEAEAPVNDNEASN